MTKATPARKAALKALTQARVRDAFIRDILPGVLDSYCLSGSDRAFATRLALGCIQMQGSLDDVIDGALTNPRGTKPTVRDALRVSTYEMLFLQRDAYAAVDQGVELVATVAPHARGLANAVLRKVSVRAKEFPFGDPETDIAAAARRYGFPLWLANNLEQWLGADKARDFMRISEEAPPVFAAVCAMRATESKVLERLREADIGVSRFNGFPVSTPGCFVLNDPKEIASSVCLELIQDGSIIVSDAAAQAVACIAATDAGGFFLDACSGRGTKTALIQSDALRNTGRQIEHLVALDNVASKMRSLKQRLEICEASYDQAIVGDAANLNKVFGDQCFDTVFIDAPCTGLGTLRRHPEIRWKITPEDIDRAADLDARLLASAAQHISFDGRLVYATCTITPQENQNAIENFLTSSEGAAFALEPINDRPMFMSHLTSGGCDAHFCAVMRKIG